MCRNEQKPCQDDANGEDIQFDFEVDVTEVVASEQPRPAMCAFCKQITMPNLSMALTFDDAGAASNATTKWVVDCKKPSCAAPTQVLNAMLHRIDEKRSLCAVCGDKHDKSAGEMLECDECYSEFFCSQAHKKKHFKVRASKLACTHAARVRNIIESHTGTCVVEALARHGKFFEIWRAFVAKSEELGGVMEHLGTQLPDMIQLNMPHLSASNWVAMHKAQKYQVQIACQYDSRFLTKSPPKTKRGEAFNRFKHPPRVIANLVIAPIVDGVLFPSRSVKEVVENTTNGPSPQVSYGVPAAFVDEEYQRGPYTGSAAPKARIANVNSSLFEIDRLVAVGNGRNAWKIILDAPEPVVVDDFIHLVLGK